MNSYEQVVGRGYNSAVVEGKIWTIISGSETTLVLKRNDVTHSKVVDISEVTDFAIINK